MAIYSTVFLAQPEHLLGGFPGWKLPLTKPVTRTFMNPLLKEEVTLTSREPEWPDHDRSAFDPPEYGVIRIQGDYGTYLENRLPVFVREHRHWCAKGLTSVEVDPLIALVVGSDVGKLEPALFAHPSIGAAMDVFPEAFVQALGESNEFATRQLAQRYAKLMSEPRYTHSVSGRRLEPDMTLEDALQLVRPIQAVAAQRNTAEQMYLLVEA